MTILNHAILSAIFAMSCFSSYAMDGFWPPKPAKSTHTGFLRLPSEFQNKSIMHWKCDCNELASQGHVCGSHALRHAVELNEVLGLSKSQYSSAEEVMMTFKKLNIGNNKLDMEKTVNIMKVASAMKLNHIFISIEGFGCLRLMSLADDGSLYLLSVTQTLQNIEKLRHDFYQNNEKKVQHFFVCFESANVGHVALISISNNGDDINLEICDNLNEPLVAGQPLFIYVQYLYNIYFGENKPKNNQEHKPKISLAESYQNLFDLVSPDDYSRFLEKENKSAMANYLIEKWLLIEHKDKNHFRGI